VKKTVAGALGVGVLGALGVSAMAMAHGSAPAAVESGRQVAQVSTLDSSGGTSMTAVRNGHLVVQVKDVHGQRIAQVDITALRAGGNQVSIHAWHLTPGFHGVHIHSAGVCDPAGAKPFASAGGHFNPTGTAEGMQAGAFPVLLAGANGEAQTQFTDANFKISDLITTAGTSIVVHAAADNYANIPTRYVAGGQAGPDAETQMTGDSGARLACGVISAPKTGASAAPSGSGAAHPASPAAPAGPAGPSASHASPSRTATSTKSTMPSMPGMPGMGGASAPKMN
jgi:superoxide dismutase, Cu-Zn family